MSATVLLSPEKLYWAVLAVEPGVLERGDAPGSQVVRHTRTLDELFSGFIPVEPETVKTAYAVIDATRVLAVAAPREALSVACDGATVVVQPAGVPAGIMREGVALPEGVEAGLNLLWGDLEAAPVVRARRRTMLTAAAVIVAAAGLALVGLERRTASLREATAAEWRAVDKTLASAYRRPTREAGMAALDAELSRLVRTRAPRAAASGDAADALQRLLAAWPREGTDQKDGKASAKVRTDTLSATADVVTLTVAVERREQVERLSAALRTIPGWKLPQPQFAAAQSGAGGGSGGTLNLRLAADASAKGQGSPLEGGR